MLASQNVGLEILTKSAELFKNKSFASEEFFLNLIFSSISSSLLNIGSSTASIIQKLIELFPLISLFDDSGLVITMLLDQGRKYLRNRKDLTTSALSLVLNEIKVLSVDQRKFQEAKARKLVLESNDDAVSPFLDYAEFIDSSKWSPNPPFAKGFNTQTFLALRF